MIADWLKIDVGEIVALYNMCWGKVLPDFRKKFGMVLTNNKFMKPEIIGKLNILDIKIFQSKHNTAFRFNLNINKEGVFGE